MKDRTDTTLGRFTFDDNTQKSTTFDLAFPNTLVIELKNNTDENFVVHLKSVKLSGLHLSTHIVNQICQFRAFGSTHKIVSPTWHQSGIILIDFFAQDWIQYHLLYGNKINKP
jgi:hypothetical protein